MTQTATPDKRKRQTVDLEALRAEAKGNTNTMGAVGVLVTVGNSIYAGVRAPSGIIHARGALPPSYFKRPRTVYILDGKEWELEGKSAEAGGEWWTLTPWPHSFPIDAGDFYRGKKVTRKRLAVTVETVG